jgi:hypothetical protein
MMVDGLHAMTGDLVHNPRRAAEGDQAGAPQIREAKLILVHSSIFISRCGARALVSTHARARLT